MTWWLIALAVLSWSCNEAKVPTVSDSPELAQLASQLDQDAANGAPPAGAASVRQSVALGQKATPLLRARATSKGPSALLALEALRGADPAAYAALPASERAAIYVEALRSSVYFNAWGAPGLRISDTAQALVALGEPAAAALRPLLGDQRPAPLSGSNSATYSSTYGNRVCDYAWVFLSEIDKRPYRFDPDPAERDKQIAAYKLGQTPP